MAASFRAHRSPEAQLAGAYVRKLPALLDPNIPSTAVIPAGSVEPFRGGRNFALAMLVSLGLWAVIGAIIYYFA